RAATEERGEVGWGLVHFGSAQSLVPRLAAHRAFCLRRGVRCLVISDDIPQLCITPSEVKFEFLPVPGATSRTTPGGHAAAVDHSFRRLGLILDFWQVVGCDWEGPLAEDLLEQAPAWAHPVVLAARAGRRTASQRG
ncbi:MAG TPA: hypothetical protein VK146_10700, partial [Tabrizicola sp.]|nr:hypothetical protein [Tabrizicola sp.]